MKKFISIKILLFNIFIIINFFNYSISFSNETVKKNEELNFTMKIVPSVLGGRLSSSENIKIFECTDKKNKKTLISLNKQSPEILQKYLPSVLEFHNFPNGISTYHLVEENHSNSLFPAFISKAISKVYWDEDIKSWWWYESRISNQTPKNYYILYNTISDNYERTKDTVKYEITYFKLPATNNKVNQNLKKNLNIPFERYMSSFEYKEVKIGKNLYQEIDDYMLKFVNEEISIKNLLNTEFEFVNQNSETFLKSSTCTKKDYFSKLEEIYKKLLENN